MHISRRKMLVASCLGLVAGGLVFRPSDLGGAHNHYFSSLAGALKRAGIAKPTMIVDKTRVQANIRTLMEHVSPDFHYRMVAKSLPSTGLLGLIRDETNSHRYMVFNEPFIREVIKSDNQADILLGKPMPVAAAKAFYTRVDTSTFDHARQLQWLIDSELRLQQYVGLADNLGVTMQCNIELDVGLHRGGVDTPAILTRMLRTIDQHPRLSFSGFMGYEPHVVKVPGGAENNFAKAMQIYDEAIVVAKRELKGSYPKHITLNSGGSPTYRLHNATNSPANELAAGSCLLKPSDFDIDTLSAHQPACFIAAPVLKVLEQTEIPGVDVLGELMSAWDVNRKQAAFIYGGNWKANPVSPPGLSINPLYGRSSNQEMLNGSQSVALAVDDWVFLRPTQSESVMLQFGDLAVYADGEIAEYWPVFSA